MAFFITDGILDFLLNQRLLDMTHYIKSFIAATMDEGKKWMIISGGGGKAGGLKVDTNTKSNLLKKNGIDSDAMYERIRQKNHGTLQEFQGRIHPVLGRLTKMR